RGRRQVLVHAGLKLDVVLLEMLSRREKLLVVAAKGGTAVAGDEAGRIQAHGAVAPDLRHRQADPRLDAGQKDVACPLGVFLVEADRTLVDSHLSPRKSWSRRLSLASHPCSLEPVYVGFCRVRSTNIGDKSAFAKIAISCRDGWRAI